MDDVASDEDLVGLLDATDQDAAEEAKAELISRGASVAKGVATRVGGFGRYGKLLAIEVLSEIGDSSTGQALLPLLDDEDSVVREWAVEALGNLRVASAIEPLHRLYVRMLAEDNELDFTGPMRVRHALSHLGGRSSVVPTLTASLANAGGDISVVWPSDSLGTVISDLADHAQVVLYFGLWRKVSSGHHHWMQHEGAPGATTG